MIKKGAERVGTAGAVMSDALFSPTSVVNRMIRLNRRDDVQSCEAVEVFRRHVLSVLDSEAAVGFAMRPGNFTIQIENHRNGLVADGMSTELQTGRISLHHAVAHERKWLHFV